MPRLVAFADCNEIPNGNPARGIAMLTALAARSSSESDVTSIVAVPLADSCCPPTVTDPLTRTCPSPAGETVIPFGRKYAFMSSYERRTRAVAESTGTDDRCWENTEPSGTCTPCNVTLIVSTATTDRRKSCTVNVTSSYVPPRAWVRNGKPPIETDGRDGKCSWVWIRAATT